MHQPMPTRRKRYTVNIPPGYEEAVKKRAKKLRRSIANYLEDLAVKDVEANGYSSKVGPIKKPDDESDSKSA